MSKYKVVENDNGHFSLKLRDKAFLHWFRGYGFQTSCTENGETTVSRSGMTMHYERASSTAKWTSELKALFGFGYLAEALMKEGVTYAELQSDESCREFLRRTLLYKDIYQADILETVEEFKENYHCVNKPEGATFEIGKVSLVTGGTEYVIDLNRFKTQQEIGSNTLFDKRIYCRMLIILAYFAGYSYDTTLTISEVYSGEVVNCYTVDELNDDIYLNMSDELYTF